MAIVQSALHESQAAEPSRFFNIRKYLESDTSLLSAIEDYAAAQQYLGAVPLDEEAKWVLRDKASVICQQGTVLAAHLRQFLPIGPSVIGSNLYFNQIDWYGSQNLFYRMDDDGKHCLFAELRSLAGEEDFVTASYADYMRLAEDVLVAST